MARRVTLRPGPERDPLACIPGLHPLAPTPGLLSREHPFSRSCCCHLRLTCVYSPSRRRRCPPLCPLPPKPLQPRISSLLPRPKTPPCSPPCPSVPAGAGGTDPADSMQTKPAGALPDPRNSWFAAAAAASLGPGRCPRPGKAQVLLGTRRVAGSAAAWQGDLLPALWNPGSQLGTTAPGGSPFEAQRWGWLCLQVPSVFWVRAKNSLGCP